MTHSWQDFNTTMLKHLCFSPIQKNGYTLYTDKKRPAHGFFLHYSRPSYYEFIVGDYTIPHDFQIQFHTDETLIRFGNVHKGTTQFRLDGSTISFFTPSSFFVIEKGVSGLQSWQAGQHFHGAELIIHEAYLTEVIMPIAPSLLPVARFTYNQTYHHLPVELHKIIHELHHLSEIDTLSPLELESKVLAAMACIAKELDKGPLGSFEQQLWHKEITIGQNHNLRFTAQDMNAIYRAHDILTHEMASPPTIHALSKRVLLNEQKLKAGFYHHYHMTLHQYVTMLRMNTAATLLATTDESIEHIAHLVGYVHTSSFIKAFMKKHGQTPLQFRKQL